MEKKKAITQSSMTGGWSFDVADDKTEEFGEITDDEFAAFSKARSRVAFDKLKLETQQKIIDVVLARFNYREEEGDAEKFNGIIMNTSKARLIYYHTAFELILGSQFDLYNAVIRFAVGCRLVNNLKYFEDQTVEELDDHKHFQTGGVDAIPNVRAEGIRALAMEAVAQFNHRSKRARLRFVETIKCNYSFGYHRRFFLTISAIDVESGRIGTYQVALALRLHTIILGLVRHVDADKVLAVLTIGGAENVVRAELKAIASRIAVYRPKESQTSVPELQVCRPELQVRRSIADKIKIE